MIDKSEHTANATYLDQRFAADCPIQTSENGLLGRQKFAQSIATAFAAWQQKDSLVVAIYGTSPTEWTAAQRLPNRYVRSFALP